MIFSEFINIIIRGLHRYSHKDITLILVSAAVFSLLMWLLSANYSKLWNKQYSATKFQHTMGAISSILTFTFIITYAGLVYIQDIAEIQVTMWSSGLSKDVKYNDQVFKKIFYKVKELNPKEFTNIKTPEMGGDRIPISNEQSKAVLAKISVDEAINNFRLTHRVLSWMMRLKGGNASEAIVKDINTFFSANNDAYPSVKGTDLAASYIKSNLVVQLPKLITYSRVALVLLFLLVQLIPFTLVGYAAYTDLKVTS